MSSPIPHYDFFVSRVPKGPPHRGGRLNARSKPSLPQSLENRFPDLSHGILMEIPEPSRAVVKSQQHGRGIRNTARVFLIDPPFNP
jgi:hypothetical protein